MFYRRQWRFPCGINALVFKKYKEDNYHIWFNDILTENAFETFCNTRDALYRVLNAGVQYLLSERKPALMHGRS